MLSREDLERFVTCTYLELVEKYFSGLYAYCYQTGSFIYGGGTPGKSDLDIAILFKNVVESLPKSELEDRIKSFVDGYLRLHRETGYIPDTVFPGEYVTEDMFADAIAGRGFHVDEAGSLYLPKASPEYYLADSERWFRAWLSQSAFCRLLIGDQDLFRKNKIGGWSTILKFLFKKTEIAEVAVEDIFGLLRPFGVHKDYYNFAAIEKPWATEALGQLAASDFISIIDNDRCVHLNKEKLAAWEKQLAEAIISGTIRRSGFILDRGEILHITEYASEVWSGLNARMEPARVLS